MNTKRLFSLFLSILLALSCLAVIPVTASAVSSSAYIAKLNYTGADSWVYMQNEFNLPAGTYQFDVDYKTEGSVKAAVRMNSVTTAGDSDEGHITYQFDWAGGAFNIFLRDQSFTGTGIVYFANIFLKALSGGVPTGDNLVWDFERQYDAGATTLTNAYAWGGKWYRSNASANAAFTVIIDGEMFADPTASGDIYLAKLNYTGADSWTYMQNEFNLAAGTYQFDVDYKTTGTVTATARMNNVSTTGDSDSGHITYQFDWAGGVINIFLRDQSFTGTGTVYFANISLKALSGGVLTGDNLVWDFSRQYDVGATLTDTYAWGGKWYRNNASAKAAFTIEADVNGLFEVPAEPPVVYGNEATTPAVYIGQCAAGSCQAATVFIPLTGKYSGDYEIENHCKVEFTCKVKVLSGTKPVIGFLRTKTDGNRTVQTENWVDNTTSALVGNTLTVRFELSDIPNDAYCYKSESRNTADYQPNVSCGAGGIWGGITIGNTAFNGNWSRQPDWSGSYIISDPSLKVYQKADGTAYKGGEMLSGFENNNSVGIYGLAGRKTVGNDTDAMNHPWRAPANKWSIMGNNPDLVRFVTVDDDYTVATRNYIRVAGTANTREYYTCGDFDGLKFEKLGTGCYSVIPDDVNKKTIVIDADGTNKVANIYLPLFTHRYFQCVGKNDGNLDWRDGYNSGTSGAAIYYHVSFNAKRLSGTGQPILGALYGADWGYADGEFRSNTSGAYNNSDSTAQSSPVMSSYNPDTGKFTAVVRFSKGYMYQMSRKGYNGVLTIGNTEHTDTTGVYDAESFGSSFAISDISIKVYDTDNTTLIDGEAAPEMVAGNYLFDPPDTAIDDHTSQHIFKTDGQGTNGRPTELYNIPVDAFGCDGAQALISVVDRSDCMANNHTLTYHSATDTTREYWSCSTCGVNYADAYAAKAISDITAAGKMIVVKASGCVQSNVLLPLAMPVGSGTRYYRFTCDMKVFGEEVPTISMLSGSWWGGNGALARSEWYNNSSEPDASGLFARYDPDNGKFTAVVKIEHSANVFAYANALSGAYAGLLLGNGRHIGNSYSDTKYFSTFAFVNPELYELEDASDLDSTFGDNLAVPITDKTLNFDHAYSATSAQCYNSEWTMYAANNPLSAPTGMWSVVGNRTWVNVTDVPANFFGTAAPKSYMLHFGGIASNYNFIVRQAFLQPGKTYQFDIDYRETSTPARIAFETANSGSYASATLTTTADNVPGAHKSVRFTMSSEARLSGNGNFRVSLGQATGTAGIQKSTNNVYFANASLREVIGGKLGENLLINSSFEFGSKGDLTEANYLNAIYGWETYTSGNMPNILTPSKHELMTVPEHFFDGVLGEYATDKALKITGQSWQYLRARVELEPGSTYRMTYNYRGEEDLSKFAVTCAGSNSGTYTVTNNYMKNDGKFEASYDIVTGSDITSNSNQDPNTWVDFRLGESVGSDQAMYLSNIRLQKLVGGVPTGSNLLGDYNPVYDDSYYPNDINETNFSSGVTSALQRHLVHNWLTSKSSSTGAVVKVSEGFFNYYRNDQKILLLRKDLLGTKENYNPYGDEMNPYRDPNNDGSQDITDLIYLKKTAVASDAGGAGYEADELKNKIMNAGNLGTSSSSKKTYYVSNSGSDSNAGTSTSVPLATISKAISKASSGDYILLRRGDTWRIQGSATNYAIPSGVTVASYGTGNKPLIIGSQKNYAGSSNWTSMGNNIWRTKIPGEIHDKSIPGTVYFFNSSSEPALIGRIIKQTNTSTGKGERFSSYSALEKEGDVYYATSRPDFTGYVYVYCSSNPGSKYGRIEIPEKSGVFDLADNVRVDNVAIKYVGGHAMNGSGLDNVTVTNCEIGYVGGAPLNSETMGNGIQFGMGGSNLKIEHCYIYQCFDAGITFQSWGTSVTTFDGVYFRENLLTNNFYNIEFWTTGAPENKSGASSGTADGIMKNIYITGNIMRFAGECFSYTQRQDTALRAANIMVTTGAYYVNTANLNITGNIFDCTMVAHVTWFWQNLSAHASKQTHVGVTISGNAYYQKAGSRDGRVNRWKGNDVYKYAGSTSTFAEVIRDMDTAPKRISWVNAEDKV